MLANLNTLNKLHDLDLSKWADRMCQTLCVCAPGMSIIGTVEWAMLWGSSWLMPFGSLPVTESVEVRRIPCRQRKPLIRSHPKLRTSKFISEIVNSDFG